MENQKQGYIRLYRKIFDWEWYDDFPTFRLFIHLLLKVNHKDVKWKGQIIKRGSCVTSRSKLASETGLSEQNVKTAIKHLISTNEITKLGTPKNTIITVLNYDLYQLANQDANQQVTNNQPTGNQQVTTNNNEKNDKNKKNINTIAHQNARVSENDLRNEFENLWELYPNKKSKNKAMRSYIKARSKKQNPVTYEEVKKGIEAYNEHIQKTGVDIQYVKHGSTWFNQECWNDDYSKAKENNRENHNGWY